MRFRSSHICDKLGVMVGKYPKSRKTDALVLRLKHFYNTTINTNISMSSFQDPQISRTLLRPKNSLIRSLYPNARAQTPIALLAISKDSTILS
jgi:hypothetical protein